MTDSTFTMTPEHWRAIDLLADGKATQEEIAQQLGIDRVTLYRWRQHAAFAEALDAACRLFSEATLYHAIARREHRVAALDERWKLLRQVIRARAKDPDHQKAPGGSTGLLVRRVRVIGQGPTAREVEEFVFDAALLKALLDHEEQAARELGQWLDRKKVEGGGACVVNVIESVDGDERLREMVRRAVQSPDTADALATLSELVATLDEPKRPAADPGTVVKEIRGVKWSDI